MNINTRRSWARILNSNTSRTWRSAMNINTRHSWARILNSNTSRQQSLLSLGSYHLGRSGTGLLEYGYPIGLAVTRDNQYLIVADSWNHQLQVCKNVNETRGVFLLVWKKTVRFKWYPLIRRRGRYLSILTKISLF